MTVDSAGNESSVRRALRGVSALNESHISWSKHVIIVSPIV